MKPIKKSPPAFLKSPLLADHAKEHGARVMRRAGSAAADTTIPTGRVLRIAGRMRPTGTWPQRSLQLYPITTKRLADLVASDAGHAAVNYLLNIALDELEKNPRYVDATEYFADLYERCGTAPDFE